MRIIDAEGHVMERDEDIQKFLEEPYRSRQELLAFPFFPTLDGFHREARRVADGKGRHIVIPDAGELLHFMGRTEIEQTVLYPTHGLGFGFIRDATWATVLARGYNNYLSEMFLRQSPRLKGMALIPVQNMSAAVTELRRAVNELGMLGGYVPAVGLREPLGSSYYDPLYKAAQELSCPLGIHGASGQGLGFDFFEQFVEVRTLAHPFAQMIQFTSIVWNGVLERFPGIRIAFLEGMCGWLPFVLERMEKEFEHKKTQLQTSPLEQVRTSNAVFHCELDEKILPQVIGIIGEEKLVCATDFPHEPAEECVETFKKFNLRNDLSAAVKEKIVFGNAQQFYRL